MSKSSLSGSIKGHAALSRTDFCMMWKITRVDGTIIGLTEYYKNLPFNLGDGDGEITYYATDPFLRSAIRQSVGLGVDVMEVEGVVGDVMTQADVYAGKYDGATVDIFNVNFSDLTMGDWPLKYGFFGSFELNGIKYKTQLNGLGMLYQNEIVELYSASCRADLGDTRCGVRLKLSDVPVWEPGTVYTARTPFDAKTGSIVRDPNVPDRYFYCSDSGTSAALGSGVFPSWNTTIGSTTTDGTVEWTTIRAGEVQTDITAVTNRGKFTIGNYAGDAAASDWETGVVEWVDGNNSGQILEIKDWNSGTGVITLYKAAKLDINVGNNIKIRMGCIKDLPTCRDTFGNTINARAEFRVPGFDLFIRTPNAH